MIEDYEGEESEWYKNKFLIINRDYSNIVDCFGGVKLKRIKFYSRNDLMHGYNLGKIVDIFNRFEECKATLDINDMIEVHNIKKYLDNEVYLNSWTPDEIKRYQSSVKLYFGMVAKFFKSINTDNFIPIYNVVSREYKDCFWELIEKFKVYKDVAEEKFNEFLDSSKSILYEVLKHKNITEYYGGPIKDHMLNDYSSAELLLDKYEIKHHNERYTLFFPKGLSSIDKEKIINSYIDSENPNLNYLRLITNIQSSKEKIEISAKTLLKAKRKAENLENQLFHKNSGMLMKTIVSFSGTQNEEVVLKFEDQAITAIYSQRWIEDNMDYATLLNNFIYLFAFVDLQMRCTLVNKFNDMGVFERFIFTSSKNAYTKGIAFDQMNTLALLQISGYYNKLFSLGTRLEEVVEWFLEEYLSSEFNAYNFKVTMPSANSTWLEKCTNIMPAMESVLKQFSLFVEEGQIDYELLEIRSEHLIYKNIPSLIEKKYVYGIGDEFNTATFFLFSDQSGLGYNEKEKKSYGNYFEFTRNENIKINDFTDSKVSKINWLIDRNYLSIDENGFIVFYDELLIKILKDLYFNEVINYWKYPELGRNIIDNLEKKNVIEYESSLFSRPETDYINYFLNKSQFNNGLDLRNKYSHTQPYNDNDDNIHSQNYLIFLKLFILSVIKINDDFSTSDQLKNK